jgi:hypothetical protein
VEQLDDGDVLPPEVRREHAHSGLAVDESGEDDGGVPHDAASHLRLRERVIEECLHVLQ